MRDPDYNPYRDRATFGLAFWVYIGTLLYVIASVWWWA